MTAPINDLLKKYREETITAEELRRLREIVDCSTDDDLASAIGGDWEEFDGDYRENRSHRWRRHALTAAAAVVLLLSAGVSAVLYSRLHAYDAAVTTFASTAFQTSTLQLPDGSKVTMSRMSELSCREASFMRGERSIKFDGEGFFEISSDADHPFVIDASGFEVVVRGTVFNLYANRGDSIAELALESGVVEIKMPDSGTTTVQPSQKAIINRKSGAVSLVQCPDVRCMSAWQRGEIILEDAGADEIAAAFRRYYGVSVDIDGDDDATFTGTLPTNSIQVAMNVVQLAFDADVTVRP